MPDMPDAVVLCGGAGTRLRTLTGDAPKSMARIGSRPFLEILLKQLQRSGYERVILAVGYQQDAIRAHFGDELLGLRIVYSPEASPLGTGGALRNAADHINSDNALVMNGDSYIDADLQAFMCFHRQAQADATLMVARVDGRGDCGTVHVAEGGKVTRFDEKRGFSGALYLNAGIYALARRMFYDMPTGVKISLETELFPRWLAEGKSIWAFMSSGACVDIGTPERFRAAQESLDAVEANPCTKSLL